MNILKTALDEVWGLFVDDPIFAASLILWLVLAKLVAMILPHSMDGIIFFIGLAGLLVGLTYRRAKIICYKKK